MQPLSHSHRPPSSRHPANPGQVPSGKKPQCPGTCIPLSAPNHTLPSLSLSRPLKAPTHWAPDTFSTLGDHDLKW